MSCEIEALEYLRNWHINDTYHGTRLSVALTHAIEALQERTQPNEPLTLAELLEMDCKPVYCVDARGVGAWAIVSATFEECIDGEYGGWEFYSYGWADSDAGWLAYRHKPEQEEESENE